MTLNQSILPRLSFIKYLHQLAVKQSEQQEPNNSASILMFHDSIELFLQLSTEYLNASTSTSINFMKYFDIINQKLVGQQVSQKPSMNRLNRARVSLKHYGMRPTESEIETYRINAMSFFEDNTPIVFGIEFSDISMIDLVENDDVKNILKDVENFSKNEQYKNALEHIVVAFDILITDYEKNKKHFGKSVFIAGGDLPRKFAFADDNRKYKNEFDKLIKSIKEIQTALKILGFNIDYRKYIKFHLLTPMLFHGKDIYDKYDAFWSFEKKEAFTKEDVEFCFNFIIESALKLQEFDFEIGENL